MLKKIFILCLVIPLMIITDCTSQIYLDKNKLDKALENKEFIFMAESANPTNYDVINVLNSMQNSTASRILKLDYGYAIVLKNNILEVTLPYFGRSFNPSYGNTDQQSFRFTSKDFSIDQSQSKKGNTIFIIKPKDISHVKSINMEIFSNGKAYVSIDANDRQPISYDGYIMENKAVTEK